MPGFWDPPSFPRVYYLAQVPPLITHLGVYDSPLIMQRGDLIKHNFSINLLKGHPKYVRHSTVGIALAQ